MISTDASDKDIVAVLLQEQPDGSLRPCSYYAKTLNKAQRKYPVYDQELLAIAAALNEYRIYIEGCANFVVITNHRLLIHIPIQPNIGRRHAPWLSVLFQYGNMKIGYMKIVYMKGSENDSDALSRREDLADLTEERLSIITFSKRNSKTTMPESLKRTREFTRELDGNDSSTM